MGDKQLQREEDERYRKINRVIDKLNTDASDDPAAKVLVEHDGIVDKPQEVPPYIIIPGRALMSSSASQCQA